MGRSGATKTWPQKERGRRKLILIIIFKTHESGFFNFDTMKRIILILFVIAAFAACKKDSSGKLTPACDGSHPTYSSDIKSILDARCGSASCHPNYTSYTGLSGIIQNGSFKRDVLTNQSMPQGSSLTQDQINKIQCWVNDGYPEN
jgi:hypothetical protein